MLNSKESESLIDVVFGDVPNFKGGEGVTVRCLWEHKDLGVFDDMIQLSIESHDARFLILEASGREIM